MLTICRICRICRICNMTNMSNMKIPNSIWTFLYDEYRPPPFSYDQYVTICKKICKIWTPPFYMSLFWKYVEYNCFLKSQIGPYRAVRPDLRLQLYARYAKYVEYAKYVLNLARAGPVCGLMLRWTYLGVTAVTLTLVSSGNAKSNDGGGKIEWRWWLLGYGLLHNRLSCWWHCVPIRTVIMFVWKFFIVTWKLIPCQSNGCYNGIYIKKSWMKYA